MNQAVHIFRKDVRHLWPQIAVVLFLFVLHAVFDVRSSPVYNPETRLTNSLSSLLTVLLPLAIWFLIALVVFQEELPGNRQYWPTRPYEKSSLLAAKILFLIVFINLPLFLSDCCILGFQDFAVLGVMPSILLRQIPLMSLYILPSLAIATLTAGLAQFFVAWFFVILVPIVELVVVQSSRSPTGGMSVGFTSESLMLIELTVITCAIVAWQYWRRQTGRARIFAACAVVAFFPALSGFSLLGNASARNAEPPKRNDSGVHVAYDRGEQPRTKWKSAPPGTALIRILLQVDRLSEGTLLRGTGLASIEVDHAPWPKAGWKYAASVERDSDGRYWQRMILPEAQLSKVQQRIAEVHTSLHLEVVTDRVAETTTLPALAIHPSIIPGIGR